MVMKNTIYRFPHTWILSVGISIAGVALLFGITGCAQEEVAEPVHVEPPFREQLFFDPADSSAVGYLFRLQPELLRGGRYTVSIEENPALALPVEGKGMADIHSFFKNPGDGGGRLHERSQGRRW